MIKAHKFTDLKSKPLAGSTSTPFKTRRQWQTAQLLPQFIFLPHRSSYMTFICSLRLAITNRSYTTCHAAARCSHGHQIYEIIQEVGATNSRPSKLWPCCPNIVCLLPNTRSFFFLACVNYVTQSSHAFQPNSQFAVKWGFRENRAYYQAFGYV